MELTLTPFINACGIIFGSGPEAASTELSYFNEQIQDNELRVQYHGGGDPVAFFRQPSKTAQRVVISVWDKHVLNISGKKYPIDNDTLALLCRDFQAYMNLGVMRSAVFPELGLELDGFDGVDLTDGDKGYLLFYSKIHWEELMEFYGNSLEPMDLQVFLDA